MPMVAQGQGPDKIRYTLWSLDGSCGGWRGSLGPQLEKLEAVMGAPLPVATRNRPQTGSSPHTRHSDTKIPSNNEQGTRIHPRLYKHFQPSYPTLFPPPSPSPFSPFPPPPFLTSKTTAPHTNKNAPPNNPPNPLPNLPHRHLPNLHHPLPPPLHLPRPRLRRHNR